MLRLWGRSSSINVQKVLWVLRELDVPFDQIEVGGRFGGLDTPTFRAINPHGRIPVIEDNGVVVWESNAIVRYVAARHGMEVLWPRSVAHRARADEWMDWCATSLQPAFMDFFWNWYRTPEPLRDAARCADLLERSQVTFAVLDRALEKRAFLAGDRLTMADIPAGSMLYRYFTLEIARPRLVALERWYAGLSERAAYRQGVMLPYDELRGRLTF